MKWHCIKRKILFPKQPLLKHISIKYYQTVFFVFLQVCAVFVTFCIFVIIYWGVCQSKKAVSFQSKFEEWNTNFFLVFGFCNFQLRYIYSSSSPRNPVNIRNMLKWLKCLLSGSLNVSRGFVYIVMFDKHFYTIFFCKHLLNVDSIIP